MRRQKNLGFTIVELLVVITIIGILMALILPAVNAVRIQARTTECISNQKQIATAIQTYDAANSYLPASRSQAPPVRGRPSNIIYGWVHPVLKNLGRGDIYDQVRDGTFAGPVYIKLLVCPADPPPTLQSSPLSYVVNGGLPNDPSAAAGEPNDNPANGVFHDRTSGAPIKNGLSYVANNDGVATTIMLSENRDAKLWTDTAAECYQTILWNDPTPSIGLNTGILTGSATLDAAHARPSSKHGDGFVVAFCDGHVRFLSDQISYQVYALLMTPNGAKAQTPGRRGRAIPQTAVVSEADLDL